MSHKRTRGDLLCFRVKGTFLAQVLTSTVRLLISTSWIRWGWSSKSQSNDERVLQPLLEDRVLLVTQSLTSFDGVMMTNVEL